jgi:hypothetical protein
LSESDAIVIINSVPHASGVGAVSCGWQSRHNQREVNSPRSPQFVGFGSGQVAQVVERSPEKAGVGGSTPSLATIIPKNLAAENRNFQPTIQPMILTELAP